MLDSVRKSFRWEGELRHLFVSNCLLRDTKRLNQPGVDPEPFDFVVGALTDGATLANLRAQL